MSAMATQAPGTSAVRFRSTFGQWAWLLGTVTATWVVIEAGVPLAYSHTLAPTGLTLSSMAAFVVFWAVVTAIIYRWQGVTLTPDSLRVHSLRPRTIAWADIAAISTDRLLGVTSVIVWETSGRSTRLRAPTTGLLVWDHDFDAKYDTIRAWHLARQGGGEPMPAYTADREPMTGATAIGTRSRPRAVTATAAALGAVLALGGAYAWGAAHPRVHVEQVQCLSAPGAISCTLSDGWDVAIPTDITWHDTDGAQHASGRPVCLPPTGRGLEDPVSIAWLPVAVEGSQWRQVVSVTCLR